MGVVRVSPPTGLCQENWPLSYVSLIRATYCTEYGQNRATIGSGQYTLLSGRPVQTGQVLFEFKFTTVQSDETNIPQTFFKYHLFKTMLFNPELEYLGLVPGIVSPNSITFYKDEVIWKTMLVRVTHKALGLRDYWTEMTVYLWFPSNVNMFLFLINYIISY